MGSEVGDKSERSRDKASEIITRVKDHFGLMDMLPPIYD